MGLDKKLRTYLKEHGITTTFLAEQIGIERSKLAKSLNGTRRFQGEEIVKICDVLKLDTNFFTD